MKRWYAIFCATLCLSLTGCWNSWDFGGKRELPPISVGDFYGYGTITCSDGRHNTFRAEVCISDVGEDMCDLSVHVYDGIYVFGVQNIPLSDTDEAVWLEIDKEFPFYFTDMGDVTQELFFKLTIMQGCRTRFQPITVPVMLDLVAEFDMPAVNAGEQPRRCTIRVGADREITPVVRP